MKTTPFLLVMYGTKLKVVDSLLFIMEFCFFFRLPRGGMTSRVQKNPHSMTPKPIVNKVHNHKQNPPSILQITANFNQIYLQKHKFNKLTHTH
jgi:hypothetical protein